MRGDEAQRRRNRSETTISAICAAGLFLLTTSIALAKADWPPPWRFAWLVAALATLFGVTFFGLRTTLAARRVPGGGQARAAAFEGAIAGLALGLCLVMVGGGVPSVTPSLLDRGIWVPVAVFTTPVSC